MITLRKDFGKDGTWWPDYDHAPEACYSKVMRRLTDASMCEPYLRSRQVVVQAGGHAGLWPRYLASRFKRVLTFECEPILYGCMQRNVEGITNIEMSDKALGPVNGEAKLRMAASAGSSRIDPLGKVTVEQITIDSLNLPSCGAIILDVEAYEVPVLKGALETIKKFSPVIHVERSEAFAQDEFFNSIGYVYTAKLHSDFLYIKGGKG